MCENPVFPAHTPEVAPWESSHHCPRCQTGVAQVCVWEEVRSQQCWAGGIPFLQTPWGWELSHPHPCERGQRSAAHTRMRRRRAVVHMYSLRAQSQVYPQTSVPRSWGRTERGGTATQEQHVLVPGRGLGTPRCRLDLLTDFKYKPDISMFCYWC